MFLNFADSKLCKSLIQYCICNMGLGVPEDELMLAVQKQLRMNLCSWRAGENASMSSVICFIICIFFDT